MLFCFAASVLLLSSCSNPSSTGELNAARMSESQSNKKEAFGIKSLFQGEYISPDPTKIDQGSYYTGLIISRIKGNDSIRVVFSSARIKTQICCSFSGTGYINHDTLFVPLQMASLQHTATMVITKIQQDDITKSVNVSLADTSHGDLLANYCCEGASLSGVYYPCDLSIFQTDTTKANQNTDLIQ